MAVVALLGVFLSACARETTVDDIDASPASLERLPKNVVESCRRVPSLVEACPTEVPAAAADLRSYDAHIPGTWGFIVEAGESETSFDQAPPEAVEVHVFAGAEVARPAHNLQHAPNFERPLAYRVSLKAWEPLESSVATLRAVVRSIGKNPA